MSCTQPVRRTRTPLIQEMNCRTPRPMRKRVVPHVEQACAALGIRALHPTRNKIKSTCNAACASDTAREGCESSRRSKEVTCEERRGVLAQGTIVEVNSQRTSSKSAASSALPQRTVTSSSASQSGAGFQFNTTPIGSSPRFIVITSEQSRIGCAGTSRVVRLAAQDAAHRRGPTLIRATAVTSSGSHPDRDGSTTTIPRANRNVDRGRHWFRYPASPAGP